MRIRVCSLLSLYFCLGLLAFTGTAMPTWAQSIAPDEWTWMGGSSDILCTTGCGQPGMYGMLGVPSATNVPGGRDGAASWTDSSGNFWLFGGFGADSKVYPTGDPDTPMHYLNDLWEFNPPPKSGPGWADPT